jgi:hypothetical protein
MARAFLARVVVLGAAVAYMAFGPLAAAGAAAAFAAGSDEEPLAVLTQWQPGAALGGSWTERGTSAAELDLTTYRCSGLARSWRRADGLGLTLSWVRCRPGDMRVVAGRLGARQPAPWDQDSDRYPAAFGADLDLLEQVDGGWRRTWAQDRYQVTIDAECADVPEFACVQLTATASKSLSAAMPGSPLDQSQLAAISKFLGVVIASCLLAWLTVSGAARLWAWRISRRRFEPPAPTFPVARWMPVDAAGSALAWRGRLRRWGGWLVGTMMPYFVLVSVDAVLNGDLATVLVAIGCTATAAVPGAVMLFFSRHPLLSKSRAMVENYGRGWWRWRRLLASSISALAVLLFGLGVLAVIAAFGLSATVPIDSLLLGGGVFAVLALLVLTYALTRLARRITAWDLQTVFEGQPDQMLYLRSFRDDEVRVVSTMLSRRGVAQSIVDAMLPIRTTRFEETLATLLRRHGPLTAVEQPDQVLPSIGARRIRLRPGNWQGDVAELAENAAAVVVSATPTSMTNGLLAEMEILATTVTHGRVVLVLGPLKPGVAAFHFDLFRKSVRHHAMFSALDRPWVNEATLVVIHVKNEGWYAWGAHTHTEWNYAVALDHALRFARQRWHLPSGRGPAADPATLGSQVAQQA